MCVNYIPTPKRILASKFQGLPPDHEWRQETSMPTITP